MNTKIGLVVILVGACLSGCAVPALLGVKTYQSGDTRIEFITGVDFGIGMNGVDNVANSRGIAPTGGYKGGYPVKKVRVSESD